MRRVWSAVAYSMMRTLVKITMLARQIKGFAWRWVKTGRWRQGIRPVLCRHWHLLDGRAAVNILAPTARRDTGTLTIAN